jgi:hypothetical protein
MDMNQTQLETVTQLRAPLNGSLESEFQPIAVLVAPFLVHVSDEPVVRPSQEVFALFTLGKRIRANRPS